VSARELTAGTWRGMDTIDVPSAATHNWVEAAEWNDGEYVSINVAALDDLEPAELASAPIKYMDGRADNWWSPPTETRHL
jgi:hypothetical protein